MDKMPNADGSTVQDAKESVMCVGPQRRTGPGLLAVAALLVCSCSSLARAENTRSNTAQAQLHITVRVVQVAMPPASDQPYADHGAIVYSLPVNPVHMDVVEVFAPFGSALQTRLSTSTGGPSVLKTTTVVAQ